MTKRPCSCCGDSTDPKDLIVQISGKEADQLHAYIDTLDLICQRVMNHHKHIHDEDGCCMFVVADLLVDAGLIQNRTQEMEKEYLERKVRRNTDSILEDKSEADKRSLKFEKRRFQKEMR
jgi:hypothetical protein